MKNKAREALKRKVKSMRNKLMKCRPNTSIATIRDDESTVTEIKIVQAMLGLLTEPSLTVRKNQSASDICQDIEEKTLQLAEQVEECLNRKKPKTVFSTVNKVHEAIKESERIAFLWKEAERLLKMMQPLNKWEELEDPNFVLDKTTGERYCNDDEETLRLKLFALILGTCTVNLIALLANSVYRLAKIITLYELRNPKNTTITNLKNYTSDIARLVFGPVLLAGMQITAMLGAITPMSNGPRDARKMYALGESLLFGFSKKAWRLAPCFRPSPEYHLFGGKIGKKNQW